MRGENNYKFKKMIFKKIHDFLFFLKFKKKFTKKKPNVSVFFCKFRRKPSHIGLFLKPHIRQFKI